MKITVNNHKRIATSATRWCDKCKDLKPVKGAAMVTKPDGIHGWWVCSTCLTTLTGEKNVRAAAQPHA